jgi:hypothetical protein
MARPGAALNFAKEKEGYAEKRESEERELQSEAPKFQTAAGVLFGLTEATSDTTLKVDAEFEF